MTYKSCKRQMKRLLEASLIPGYRNIDCHLKSIKGKHLLRIVDNFEMLQFLHEHGIDICNQSITDTVHKDNGRNLNYVLMGHVYNDYGTISIVFAYAD